jgi:hypothetical protein
MTRTSTALLTLATLLSWGAMAMAENKIVTTKDGQSYEGEVVQSGDRVTITPRGGAKVTLFKANVASIEAAPTIESQFRGRLAKLQKNDAKGRVELANWAVTKNELGLAMEALDGAIAIDPNYEEAIQLRSTLAKARKAAATSSARTAAPKKAVTPDAAAAAPDDAAATTPPARDAAPKKDHKPPKTRMVTNDEINRIRQLELQKDDAVTIRLQNGVKQRYITSTPDLSPVEFNKLTATQQGMDILNHGNAKLHSDVIIATDPATMSQFKSTVQRNVLVGCAAASCHGRGPTGVGGEKGGDFLLHNPADKTPEMYTNFMLMQGYKTTVDGKDRLMIDRARADNSLVLQYGLPLQDADIPHPEVQNFRPMFKGKNDPKYKAISEWISRTLAPVQPEYGVDLTKEPPQGSGKPAKPAERPAS